MSPSDSDSREALDAPLLAMRGIAKRFPGVQALDGVDFEVRAGEVHALVGENGAGKSTLMHILAGVYRPDAGAFDFAGRRDVALAGERAAQDLGIAIVFQERSLFPQLSVAENIFAGREPMKRWGRIDRGALRGRSASLLEELGLRLDAGARVDELSPAQQQLVEIAKALSLKARLLILDEPTAALTEAETRVLFRAIERLKRQGAGIIYITHRLEEIFGIADRVTVLRDGRWQGTFAVGETTPRRLAARMVGRELSTRERAAGGAALGPVALELRGVSDRGGGERALLKDVGLTVRAGEIVVLAGLAGAGRTETALTVFGMRPYAAGEILVGGKPVRPRSPAEAIAAGIGYLPEDRKEAGLFLEMSLSANVAAASLRRFGGWWMKDGARHRAAERFRAQLKIAARHVHQPVVELSGGSQQKVLLAKWLLVEPRVLIADEPTHGVDVGAKAEVHALLREIADRGAAVLVISSELPEALAIADRIVVLRQGRVAGEIAGPEATEERVLHLAALEAPARSAAD
jgi:ABC-type sugar transport system ATPase subunit